MYIIGISLVIPQFYTQHRRSSPWIIMDWLCPCLSNTPVPLQIGWALLALCPLVQCVEWVNNLYQKPSSIPSHNLVLEAWIKDENQKGNFTRHQSGFPTLAQGGDAWKDSSALSQEWRVSDHSLQAGNRGEGLGRHINRDIRSWAPSLAPITSKGHLCAGPVLASVSEPATAWLVWSPLWNWGWGLRERGSPH